MRLKLLLLASLTASIAGTGAALAIVFFLSGSTGRFSVPDSLALGTLIIPIALIIAASIFVYRHTARHRKLQALATALVSALLTLTLMFISTLLLAHPEPEPIPPQPPGKLASSR